MRSEAMNDQFAAVPKKERNWAKSISPISPSRSASSWLSKSSSGSKGLLLLPNAERNWAKSDQANVSLPIGHTEMTEEGVRSVGRVAKTINAIT